MDSGKKQTLSQSSGRNGDSSKSSGNEVDFHGASLVDEQGNEIEITEEMIQKAMHELDKDAYPELDKPA